MFENLSQEVSLSQHFLTCLGDREGKLLQVSEPLCLLTGYSQEELVGQSFLSIVSGVHTRAFFEELWNDLANGIIWQGELSGLTKTGEFYWTAATITPVMDRDGGLVRFVALMTDVTHYKRSVLLYEQEAIKLSAMAEDLSVFRDAAIRADRSKSEFLASLSGSFQTPLGSILEAAQLLEHASITKRDDGNLEHIREIRQAGKLLQETLDELLEWARAEAGRFKLRIEPLPLQPIVDEALSAIRPRAAGRGISLLSSSHNLKVQAECDERGLRKALSALLSVSLENNGPGGWVSLDLGHNDREATIIVAASAHLAGLIPAKLWALDAAPAFDLPPQPGLKLALALSLMKIMGGSVNIARQPEVGSSFALTFPLFQAMPEWKPGGEKVNPGRPFRILSIEDNPANAKLLPAYIDRFEEATLIEANTAFHGLRLAAALKPDVILMDIHLPGMDGYEALKRIKADPALAPIKVVALTSGAHPEQVRRGLLAGFDAYLVKPLMFEKLLETLSSFIGRASLK